VQLQLDSDDNIEAIVTVCDDYIDTRKTRLKESFLITPEVVTAHWRPKRSIDIRSADLEVLLATKAEIYLVGTGPDQYFPGALELQSFIKSGKTIDFMNSRAACRTYNLLASEGRKVAAAIIIESD
jgi:uncharacterized protein